MGSVQITQGFVKDWNLKSRTEGLCFIYLNKEIFPIDLYFFRVFSYSNEFCNNLIELFTINYQIIGVKLMNLKIGINYLLNKKSLKSPVFL